MWDTIKFVASVISSVTIITAFIGALTKSGRKIIKKLFSSETKELSDCIKENGTQLKELSQITMEQQRAIDSLVTDMRDMQELARNQCRNTITDIYYKYVDKKTLPYYQKKLLDYTYNLYTSPTLNGNSFIKELYEEMLTWKVDITNSVQPK